MSDLIVDVISKSRVLFSGNLSLIVVPGEDGEMGFMEGHEPYVVALKDGIIRGRTHSGKLLVAAIMGGYAQVLGRRVIIVCDKARALPVINMKRAKESYEKLSKQLETLEESHIISKSVITRRLRWLEVQMNAKEREHFYRD